MTGRSTVALRAELVVRKPRNKQGVTVNLLLGCPKPRAEPEDTWQAWQLEPGTARMQPRRTSQCKDYRCGSMKAANWALDKAPTLVAAS